MAIAQNTCIKFQKRAGETDYVEIKNERGEGYILFFEYNDAVLKK